MNKRERILEWMREASKYLFLMAVGIILFKYASAYAEAQRGGIAIGGEFVLLLLPALYMIFRDMFVGIWEEFRDIAEDWKEMRRKERIRQIRERRGKYEA